MNCTGMGETGTRVILTEARVTLTETRAILIEACGTSRDLENLTEMLEIATAGLTDLLALKSRSMKLICH